MKEAEPCRKWQMSSPKGRCRSVRRKAPVTIASGSSRLPLRSPSLVALASLAKAIAAAMLLIFVSCSDGEESGGGFTIDDFGGKASLTGTWDGEAAGEAYTINVAGGTFDAAGAYAGSNMSVAIDTPSSGRLIIQYTRALKAGATSAPWYSTDSSEAPDVGKWYAIYFKVIDRNVIAISGGWKTGGTNAFDSAASCRNAMTMENGYFARASECRRR